MGKFSTRPAGTRRPRCLGHLLLLALGCGLPCGCAALTNPVADAVPVRRLPEELLAHSKENTDPLPLTLLRQPPPATYRLAAGDVLGVYIEGFLGVANQPPPVNIFPVASAAGQRVTPPSSGYPVPVEENGTVNLPMVGAVPVAGLNLAEAREAIRQVYVQKKLLKEGTDRVLVNLLTPRNYQVIVFRQEAATWIPGPTGQNVSKRGTGHLVQLPAYENDLLHALAATGGLPAEDAVNRIIIFRDCFQDAIEAGPVLNQLEKLPPGKPLPTLTRSGKVIIIPLRIPHGEVLKVKLEDVVLHTGDVVYLEPRINEFYYTGGLLPPGAFELPRDYDVDVIEAIAQVKGPLFNGAFGGSNLSGDLLAAGIGNPSPSLLVVLRRTPNGSQVPIAVDLRKALKDPRERILVKAGDVLMLQEQPGEALARYVTQTFFNFDLSWEVIHERFLKGVIGISAPNRVLQTTNQLTTFQ